MAGLGGVLYAHYVLTLTPAIEDGADHHHRSHRRHRLLRWADPGRAADQLSFDLSAGVRRMEPGAFRGRDNALLSGGACRLRRGPASPLAAGLKTVRIASRSGGVARPSLQSASGL